MTEESGGASEGETDCSPGTALQRPMYGACVVDEVESSPGVAGEEFGGKEIALQSVTATACRDKIAGSVQSAFGEWKDVIDRGDVEVQRGGAVHAAPSAITHHGVFDRTLLV